MSAVSVAADPEPTLRSEAEALLAATVAGIGGGVLGLLLGITDAAPKLWGDWSFAAWAAIAASIAAGVSAALGYWRSRTTDGTARSSPPASS